MVASSLSPAGMAGYLVADLERFLVASDARTGLLREAIAEARARRDAATAAADAAVELRRRVAEVWVAAQRDADTIRAGADADARALIQEAEQTARALRAQSLLERRMTGSFLDSGSAAALGDVR